MTVVAGSITEQLRRRHTAWIMHQMQYRMLPIFFGVSFEYIFDKVC